MMGSVRSAVADATATLSVDHSYSPRQWSIVAVATFLASYYGAWVLADIVPRLPAFLILLVGAGYILTRRPTGRGVARRACYLIAGFTVLIPVVVWLVFLTSPSGLVRPLALVLTPADVWMFVGFAVLAAVIAGIGRYVGPDRG